MNSQPRVDNSQASRASGFWLRLAQRCALPLAVCAALASHSMPGAAHEEEFDGSIAGLQAIFVNVKGTRTRYYDVGAGEPMLLIHGSSFRGTASANTWAPVIPLLAQSYRVFAADALGAGMTDNPATPDGYNMAAMVRHIYEFVRTQELGRIHLVGQSTGAGTALLFAAQHPEMVRTLVIVNSNSAAPAVGETDRAEALAHCPDKPWEEAWLCIHRGMSHDPEHMNDEDGFVTAAFEMEAQPRRQETAEAHAAGLIDWRDEFAAQKEAVYERVMNEDFLTMPTLLYWGSSDPSAMLHRGLALYDILSVRNPQVRMRILNGGGHFFWREHPEEFARAVVQFVQFWNDEPRQAPSYASREVE